MKDGDLQRPNPQVPDKKVALQNLDDFDGMAPPPQPKVDNEPGRVRAS